MHPKARQLRAELRKYNKAVPRHMWKPFFPALRAWLLMTDNSETAKATIALLPEHVAVKYMEQARLFFISTTGMVANSPDYDAMVERHPVLFNRSRLGRGESLRRWLGEV